jgi:cell division protein FtsW
MSRAAPTIRRPCGPARTGCCWSIAVALLPIGLVAISSASVGYAEAHYGDMWHHTLRHSSTSRWPWSSRRSAIATPVAFWYRSGWLWLLLVSLLLILVLVPGVGATSTAASAGWRSAP